MSSHVTIRLFVSLLALAMLLPAADWKPIDSTHLELAEPRVEPDADAEAIFWETWVADEMRGGREVFTEFRHYVRIKIFTEKGAEDQSTVDVSTGRDVTIMGLSGRTIKPDGRIVPLEKASVFDRTVAKAGGVKLKKKSFSMPDVEPGDVIEYYWREIHGDMQGNYLRLYLQRRLPVWEVIYHVKPLRQAGELGYRMNSQAFNAEQKQFEPGNRGFYDISYHDIKAFREEPDMPPDNHVRSWILIFYARGHNFTAEKYWNKHGKEEYKAFSRVMKADKPIKQAAAEIVGDASTEEEKYKRVRGFVLNEIVSVFHDRSQLSAEEKDKWKPAKKTSDILKTRRGSSREITYLYGALLKAAGLDARIALVAGRDDSFFNPGLPDPYFLNRVNIAVKVDGNWRFSDPAAPYLPDGMLLWPEEGVQALITDPKNPTFVQTPLSGPEKTVIRREAELTLDKDGAVHGTVTMVLTGHSGSTRKSVEDGKSAEELEEDFTASLQRRLAGAEVTELSVENLTDIDKPYTCTYKIRVPGYAMKTGKRIFLQPAFFQYGRSPRYSASERIHDLYFHYSWMEEDKVTIRLPEGFRFENLDAPQPFQFGQVGAYEVKLTGPEPGVLVHTRTFRFGDNAGVYLPATSYLQLKAVFDRCHQMDNHAVTLRSTASTD